jgi:acetylornithine/succinyldiaminopimelate/putrescine aminotransferase
VFTVFANQIVNAFVIYVKQLKGITKVSQGHSHTQVWELLSKFALIRWLYKYVLESERDVVFFTKPSKTIADSPNKATFCIACVAFVVEITRV